MTMKIDISLIVAFLIALIGAFALFHSKSANAETYIGTVPMGCDNPTERTDGTPLDCLGRVEIFISDTVTDLPPPDSFSPKHTEIMQGDAPTGRLTRVPGTRQRNGTSWESPTTATGG